MPAAASPFQRQHEELRSIFAHTLAQCDIGAALDRKLQFSGSGVALQGSSEHESTAIDLARFERVVVIALGKAAVPMVQALLQRLPSHLPLEGICCGPELPEGRRDPRFCWFAGGHPAPNADSFRAAASALTLLRSATERTFVFFLVSGGGSSLFELPREPGITLKDTIAFHRCLVGSGATISEINVVRKHFSAVKGGRLAAAAGAAQQLTLFISDVPSRELDALASGPTLPDRSTVSQCREILARYHLLSVFPVAVRRYFEHLDSAVMPGHDSTFSGEAPPSATAQWITLLSNDDLVRAAAQEAKRFGYSVLVDNSCDDWSLDSAARYLLERLFSPRQRHRPVALLSGGEITVQLGGEVGSGGRNQQFALTCALELHERRLRGEDCEIIVLSAGSDGVDGNSPAAGAIVDPATVLRAEAMGWNAGRSLATFDAFPLLHALGDTIITGPTGNNLRDLRVILQSS